ncbi:hypothetical protein J132_00320 [Termitomyces sp. J132]|nr:hypothetical protein H2248_006697 [Termitomyces sp. 'cryptogamus']KNZ76045.1 hypothetical protein J132_00320 [Termitomyces sp. J132]
MPCTTAGSEQDIHACQCLNIRIRPGKADEVDTPPPPSSDEPAFSQVFVGEQGISVSHPQLTVRTRTRGVPIAGTSRFSRYTSITCLLCRLVVYRVYQTYSPDIEGKDGPLLPTEDWVERDILKSLTGWIEIHKDCLTGNAVEEAASSANFSALFNVVLLPLESPAATPEPIYERPPSRSLTASPPPPSPKFFANLQPVFLPPPFTPSHPVFSYLASHAMQESQAVRDAAEEYMTEQMKIKISEIEFTDVELRRKVNTLWKRVREGVSQIQQESGHPSVRRASASGSRERAAVNGREPTSPGTPGVSVVREFIPARVLRPRSSSPPAPRMSALSASLTSSSFYHPRARATATSPPPSDDRASSRMSNGTAYSGSTVASSTATPPVENVHQIRRNIQDGLDMATSYRYLVVKDADEARQRGRPLGKAEDAPDQSQAAGSSHPIVNNDDTQKQPEKQPLSPSRAPDRKGKKVTFDVKPAVVTIKREVIAEQAEEEENAAKADTDMIFVLEDLEGAHQGSPGKATLQLVEQPALAVRPRRQRPQNMDNLSTSFSGLRPASLPAPSLVRPSRKGPEPSATTLTLTLPRSSFPEAPASQVETSDTFSTPSPDPKMLELLAANTPSHRGAWNPESKAWQTFVKRQPGRYDSEAILEEGEDDVGTDASGFAIPDVLPKHMQQPVVAGSLPVSMKLPKVREELTLASYQPTTLASQAHTTSPTNHKKQSSAAIRKAVYAERDRFRTLDPGPLDFASVNDRDEEEQDEDDEPKLATADASLGGRGRIAAFKILKARSEIPDSGMWRSLA